MGAVNALTQLGPMARYVEDLVLTLPIIAGIDWSDPAILPMPLGDPRAVTLQGLRVALHTNNGILAATTLTEARARVHEDRPPMLEQARGPDDKIRLVTTNFELLFESCDNALASWQPPRLPDLQRHEEMEGVIHLHGRVNSTYTGADGDGFVLSSSEFGHAYLSDGWATQFVRTILDRYFVVFVGYTADDPSVQYLLEALNRSSGLHDRV
jgi:SIR2-like domain